MCVFLINNSFSFLGKIQMLMKMYSTPALYICLHLCLISDCQILMKFPVSVESTVLDEKFHAMKDEQMAEHLDRKRK